MNQNDFINEFTFYWKPNIGTKELKQRIEYKRKQEKVKALFRNYCMEFHTNVYWLDDYCHYNVLDDTFNNNGEIYEYCHGFHDEQAIRFLDTVRFQTKKRDLEAKLTDTMVNDIFKV